MELATIFLIWLAITVIDNLAKRKKRRLLPSTKSSPDFDIPTLPNGPNLPGEEVSIFIESSRQAHGQSINRFGGRVRQNRKRFG
ncbi:MAG: hypothetical protein IJQ82_11285 [Selenomonadaceae bacterium]|nr:hypothetical protein [Selenomonadaceae bacterium]